MAFEGWPCEKEGQQGGYAARREAKGEAGAHATHGIFSPFASWAEDTLTGTTYVDCIIWVTGLSRDVDPDQAAN